MPMPMPSSHKPFVGLAACGLIAILLGWPLVPASRGSSSWASARSGCRRGSRWSWWRGRRWRIGRSRQTSTRKAGSTSPIRRARTTTSRSSLPNGRTGSSGSRTRDGDGTYEIRTIFADHMMFPEGTMWHDGSLYVSAPPSIWKLTDTNGDGVADQRVEWFQGKTLTGCANDLHGPYLGPDGWIYWCKGAFAVRPTNARASRRSSPERRTSSAAGPTARTSSRS